MTTLLTPKQAGERVGYSAKKIREFIQRGELRGFNTASDGYGARYRIDPADLDRWKNSRQVAA